MYRSLFDEVGEDVVEQEIQVRQRDTYYQMRPYQEMAVRNTFERWEAGDVATLVCLPTGTGKTVVFSEVMRRFAESN
jgi:superfamily II DNA or RNA helicase